ncbi:Fe-S cluster assembly protein SufD [Pelagibacteraceae bacterium]|jgi:Fe-S cluster assembly protein SufD|nr:Fe-S cluster assembly protein SufD [Pelagibacteraceae bacterium]
MTNFYDFRIENIKDLSSEEKNLRKKNLDLFFQKGFPNKKNEDWKFTDLNAILGKNFNNIANKNLISEEKKLKRIDEFEHNFIFLVDGKLISNRFDYEDKNSIFVKDYNYKDEIKLEKLSSLTLLNSALATGGFTLEVSKNYRFIKPLVIYNYFSKNLKESIINNKNSLILNEESELTLINYIDHDSNENFMTNTVDNIVIKKNASLKNIFINNSRCNGYFYRFIKTVLEKGSSCDNYLLSTGLKFNKLDMEIEHKEENSRSSIFSALNLLSSEHQEIKTRINHDAPNCQSYQKIKNVLNDNSKGVYQGKIFVKNIAQKTDAYQLSKALILNDNSEFDAKPELEIYADDVKCSHGSTSGSIDFDSLHYLKSRGIPKTEALKMLINGFLNEVLETLSDKKLKFFLLEKLENQINGN